MEDLIDSIAPKLTGVSKYIPCTATVSVWFPIGTDGKARAACSMCRYYRPSSNRCTLTDEVIYKAQNYIGNECPFFNDLLIFFEEDKTT